MALISPGVEVTVIDESQYIPSAVNTVPYFLIATAQNKVSADGATVAAGTLESNANKTYLITSQRDLAATFGVPFFYQTTTGTPINGYELNEYGLLAAYSTLGVTNRAFVQRVDIDLAQLTASLSRPVGEPADGTYWLDTTLSRWGIQEWNQATSSFTVKTPIVVTDTADVVDFANDIVTPLVTVGSIGDYAISAVSPVLEMYYKNTSNQWVLLGSDAWKTSWPTITGTGTPTSLTAGATFRLNDSLITVPNAPDNTVAGLAAAITAAAIAGVSAAVTSGRLSIFANSTATNDGSTGFGGIVTVNLGVEPVASQALLTLLGIPVNEYYAPAFNAGYSYQVPRWRTTDTAPAPTGSIWNNVSPVNNGLALSFKKYNRALASFISQPVPAYADEAYAIYGLDPSGGGKNIPVGTTFLAPTSISNNYLVNSGVYEILERSAIGATVVSGSAPPTSSFASGSSFIMTATQPGVAPTNLNPNLAQATVVIDGTTPAAFVAAVSAANIPFVSASVNSAGTIVFTHSAGGDIGLTNLVNTPLVIAGFTLSTPGVRPSDQPGQSLLLSNWQSAPGFTYTASDTTPDQDPANGRLWYYSTVSDADIMIQNNGTWQGYKNVTNDVRGFNLSETNAAGPIVAATAPTSQTDLAESPLVFGDLWIDSSDLEAYPALYRWEPVNGVNQWVPIDTSDQVSENGILFADARWAPNGTTDPVADPIPTIASLLTSNYLDLDAPSPDLYPEGTLLFNTRRSGYNIKSFQNNYFNAASYPDDVLPAQKNTWLTASGNKGNGAMWSGRQAQRQMVVQAMRAGLDTSASAREEQSQYSLIATPAYPELMPNMIALSNERNNTLFVIGDTPMRLAANGTDLTTWATNNGGLGLETGDGLVAASQYMGTFYPSCLTTDLGGQQVVQPPSHMMMRTIIRSDAVSYPWLAPAGTRRGVVDNATAIGYIDSATGEFQQINVGQGLRDVLYENDINPITFIPGVGITNFGNKTTTSITSALDRINVSRLVAFLRGRLEEIGKLYLFEPNDEITRNEITNTVNSLMVDLIAKRAIYDYLVVCDLSNNTPGRIDRNELWVDVAIEPVKAVEFIYIPLRIKNTGEISGGA
jgi:Phage tail sheath C-terminal domain